MVLYSVLKHQPIPYQINDVCIRQQSVKMEDENFTANFHSFEEKEMKVKIIITTEII